jgi:nucleoid DNA-binding protein
MSSEWAPETYEEFKLLMGRCLREAKGQTDHFGNKVNNKDDLIREIGIRTGFGQRDVEHVLNSFVDTTTDALARGEKVLISKFGRFELKKKKGRVFNTPQHGRFGVSHRYIPALKPSNELRNELHRRWATRTESVIDDWSRLPEDVFDKLNNIRDFLDHDEAWVRELSAQLLARIQHAQFDAGIADQFDQSFAKAVWRSGYGDPSEVYSDPISLLQSVNMVLRKFKMPTVTELSSLNG